MPKIITIPREVDLIDQVVNYDKIREIGLFGACFQNIEDKRAMGIFGENIGSKIIQQEALTGNVRQKDFDKNEKGVCTEIKTRRMKKRSFKIDPFYQDEIDKVLNGEVKKVIITVLIDDKTGQLLYIYAADAKDLFDPKNELVYGRSEEKERWIYVNEKFKKICKCLLSPEIMTKIQNNTYKLEK